MMLPAGVEATRHLDVQITHCRVDPASLLPFHELLVELCRQATRGRDAQLASISTRARNHVLDLPGATQGQVQPLELREECRQVSLRNPTQNEVLLNG